MSHQYGHQYGRMRMKQYLQQAMAVLDGVRNGGRPLRPHEAVPKVEDPDLLQGGQHGGHCARALLRERVVVEVDHLR